MSAILILILMFSLFEIFSSSLLISITIGISNSNANSIIVVISITIVVGFTIVSVWIRFIQYWQVLVITRVAGE